MTEYFVVMGGIVRADGSPGHALQRRIEGAARLSAANSNARFLATGAVGVHPPAEAIVIRDGLVQLGISDDRILIDTESHDTLSSAFNCSQMLHEAADAAIVTICSDRFHVLRCTLLFHIAGIPARPGWIASGRREFGLTRWIYYWVRDFAATIWDVPIALVRRLRGPA